jgi:hypothetical protein
MLRLLDFLAAGIVSTLDRLRPGIDPSAFCPGRAAMASDDAGRRHEDI